MDLKDVVDYQNMWIPTSRSSRVIIPSACVFFQRELLLFLTLTRGIEFVIVNGIFISAIAEFRGFQSTKLFKIFDSHQISKQMFKRGRTNAMTSNASVLQKKVVTPENIKKKSTKSFWHSVKGSCRRQSELGLHSRCQIGSQLSGDQSANATVIW